MKLFAKIINSYKPIIFTKNHHQRFCWLTLLGNIQKWNSRFAAMQPAILRKKCPFQVAFFLEVEGMNQWKVIRSSCPEVFCKEGALRNFAKFTGKHLCQSLFFNTVAGLSLYFLQNTSGGCFRVFSWRITSCGCLFQYLWCCFVMRSMQRNVKNSSN